MNVQTEQKILVGGHLTDTTAVRVKVEQDIAFLTGQISNMEKHARPNKIVLETYKGMLKSRISVLKWLIHGSDDEETSVQRSA